MMQTGLPVNGFPPLAGLPLFDWRPPAIPSRPSPRASRALEIARATGLPLGVVIVHMQAAGLGLEG
ncbi:hypothetical protein [Ancylobacter sp. TS-1]|uniref:hypothetical protein n=1 Tax=Ancylobacter sp. TS-1 TaxID=1850374 RepID=UPI001265B19D|nr:hypothetical protein [Ancylobacter sp. TS-1]QFR34708.1 hypothetical protein GBB76_17250 [Ancylobacter sp. TS-1]